MRTLEAHQYALIQGAGIVFYDNDDESIFEVTNGCQFDVKLDNKPLFSLHATGDITYYHDNINWAKKTDSFELPIIRSTPIAGGTRFTTID